jgi:hypothetical protein
MWVNTRLMHLIRVLPEVITSWHKGNDTISSLGEYPQLGLSLSLPSLLGLSHKSHHHLYYTLRNHPNMCMYVLYDWCTTTLRSYIHIVMIVVWYHKRIHDIHTMSSSIIHTLYHPSIRQYMSHGSTDDYMQMMPNCSYTPRLSSRVIAGNIMDLSLGEYPQLGLSMSILSYRTY